MVKTNTVPNLESPVTTDADDQAMLRQVIEYCHQTLKQEPEARAYGTSRRHLIKRRGGNLDAQDGQV